MSVYLAELFPGGSKLPDPAPVVLDPAAAQFSRYRKDAPDGEPTPSRQKSEEGQTSENDIKPPTRKPKHDGRQANPKDRHADAHAHLVASLPHVQAAELFTIRETKHLQDGTLTRRAGFFLTHTGAFPVNFSCSASSMPRYSRMCWS